LATYFSENAKVAEKVAFQLSSAAEKVVIVSVAEVESLEEDSPAVTEKRKDQRS